ncbi:MAG: UDP-N-acetylglucosamine diphosphorylase/glucosamine-1-phosphate N-acetyltransferase [Bdellovibrio sp.]|nr:MAG: UDP-N-acetylglucosamine diphosphorylase/glucosamine-1-phosphate N-acetyltransferase [Bdellovibrio sp.]
MKENNEVTAIILAAGLGKRMKSPLPKILHPVAGRPMILHVIENCKAAGFTDIRLVAGFGLNSVKAVVEPLGVQIHVQAQQLGTGDAVKSADIESLSGDVLILNGDHPLIEAEDLLAMVKEFRSSGVDLMVVTTILENPKSFGRVVRSGGQIRAIVEAKDATQATLNIREVNTGMYLIKADVLQDELPRIRPANAQNEYYLTDLVGLCIEGHLKVGTFQGPKRVSWGVNSQTELAEASRIKYRQKARRLMEDGVILMDPRTTYVESTVRVEPGAVLYPHVMLRGNTRVGAMSSIEPHCYVVDTDIGNSVQIRAGSYLESARIMNHATVGPYARLRPETVIAEEAHVGNFVEMKKVQFGARSKAGHLTYLGDAEVGEDANVGCGTITCNYAVDRKKYKTVIGKRVFVGSDTQFVAPVTVGDGAVIGSGSTITKDVPPRALAVGRARQVVKENYVKDEAAKGDSAGGNEAADKKSG